MKKKWEYYEQDADKIKYLTEKFNISDLIAKVLINRQITDESEINVFLNPTRNDFHDPFLLKDMNIAVERIEKAILNNEKVIIYGDYDVDGITSISVLKKFLSERGLETGYYIPSRLDEGYGLNKNAIDKISQDKYTLMITVDCGISGMEEVEYANKLGIETIITDHHEPLDELPNALAIINPKRVDSGYPFRGLAGVGVAFKLIQALSIKMNLDEKEYLKYLDIVCLGTISDIVPLVNENRVIASLGLKLVEVTKNVGLKELLKSSKYNKIDSSAVSFGLAPRINACGRMGHADKALKLFLTNNIVEASSITQELNNYNIERQNTEKRIFEEALEKIKLEENKNNNAIILSGDNWHHGVIGIVSSKITEMFYKPSILICFEGDEGKGSGRSVRGFDLHNALCKTSQFLEKYGGHEMAVGLSLKRNQFNNFKDAFEKIAEESNLDEIQPVLKIDAQINSSHMNIDLIRNLNILEPFGEANKIPIFEYKCLKIDSIRSLSDGKHLKLTLKDGNLWIDAIGFNMGNLAEEYLIGDRIDLACTLEINSFNKKEKIQLNIKDIRKSLN